MEKKRRVALSWRLDVFGIGFGVFGIYLEVLLYREDIETCGDLMLVW